MHRDVQFIDHLEVVIATDFAQCIGPLENDQLEIPYETLVDLTIRSVIVEIIAVNANPKVLTFSNSLGNKGYSAIQNRVNKVKNELSLEHLDFLVSSEKNFTPHETALSITGVGNMKQEELKLHTPENAILGIIGQPLVGEEVLTHELLSLSELKELIQCEEVYEILPVGSHGINYELKYFTTDEKRLPFDGHQSAGPSTCFIISFKEGFEEKIDQLSNHQLSLI